MAKRTQHFDPRQSMRGDTYEVFHYQDIESRHLEAHYHDFYEIYFFLDGEMDYWINGTLYHLQAGDLLFINPTELHRPVPRGDGNTYERMVLWLNRSYLAGIENGLLESCFELNRRLLRPDPATKGHIQALATRLVEESYSEDFGSKCCSYGLLLQLLCLINRTALNNSPDVPVTPTLISQVLSYLGTHFNEHLTLDMLANHFFISKYYLSHEFHRTVGVSVHRYITLKRLNYAYDLLSEGHPAGQVALLCGFGDYTAFYKAFKAEYGISPSTLK